MTPTDEINGLRTARETRRRNAFGKVEHAAEPGGGR